MCVYSYRRLSGCRSGRTSALGRRRSPAVVRVVSRRRHRLRHTRARLLSTSGVIQSGILFAGFNDGSSPAPGNRVGDIFARIRIICAGTTNQAEITWAVVRCTDAACATGATLRSGSLGPATIGQEYTLRALRTGSTFQFTAKRPDSDVPRPRRSGGTAQDTFHPARNPDRSGYAAERRPVHHRRDVR